MDVDIEQKRNIQTEKSEPPRALLSSFRQHLFSLLTTWELYPLLALTIFLRFYRLDTVQFMDDHAAFYRMAHDAVAHGYWPLSGNRSSTGPLIAPLFTYLMMIPAAISANPISGHIFIALFNTAAVVLTYFFVRRYYGRLAAIVASFFYATSVGVLIFSRDIWQPDLMPFFVLLFIWALFRGVVDQRKGWLFPALALLGILYQLHNTSVYLVIPLAIAFILAFKRIRIRDFLFSVIALFFLLLPYIILQYINRFADIFLLFNAAKNPSRIDGEALYFYQWFLAPFVQKRNVNEFQYLDTHIFPGNEFSIIHIKPLSYIYRFMLFEYGLMLLLLCGGMLTLFALIVWPRRSQIQKGIRGWLADFLATPSRQGLLLLLGWQGTVFLMLSHSVNLFAHYLIFLLPGQFILIALFLSKATAVILRYRPRWHNITRYGITVLVVLVVFMQSVGSVVMLVDRSQGYFNSTHGYPEYFDLASQQHFLEEADTLAQERGISRIYVTTSFVTKRSLEYLSEQVQTPIALFDTWNCFVLPASSAGSVVFLSAPNNDLAEITLSRYANVTLVKELPHLGGAPYKLSIVTAKPEPEPVMALGNELQALSTQASLVKSSATEQNKRNWLETRWRVLKTQKSAPRTMHNFSFLFQSTIPAIDEKSGCGMSATWAGDQIFLYKEIGKDIQFTPTAMVSISAFSFTTAPVLYIYGALTFTTFYEADTPWNSLKTPDGKQRIDFPVQQ